MGCVCVKKTGVSTMETGFEENGYFCRGARQGYQPTIRPQGSTNIMAVAGIRTPKGKSVLRAKQYNPKQPNNYIPTTVLRTVSSSSTKALTLS